MRKIILLLIGMIFLIGMVSSVTWNPVAYYKLDGGALDEVNGYHGVNYSAVYNSSAVINQAFTDGTGGYINISDQDDFDFDGAFSISLWFYYNGNPPTIISKAEDASDASDWWIDYEAGGNSIRFFSNLGEILGSTADDCEDGSYHHIVVTRDGSNDMVLYVDNVSRDTASFGNDLTDTDPILIGARRYDATSKGLAYVDEVGIWKGRALSVDEVSELWNGGAGLEYGMGGLPTTTNVELNSPTNETATSETAINFTANYNISTSDYNWTNVTYSIWFANGTVFNNSYTEIISGTDNTTTVEFSGFSFGDYEWNVYACYGNATFNNCTWADENYTLTVAGSFTNFVYTSPVLETSLDTFSVDLTIPNGTSIQANSGKIIYNGTSYSSVTVTSNGENNYTISRNIYLPGGTSGFGSENRTFYWNITIIDINSGKTFTQSSDEYGQNVTELKFGLCDATLNIPLLNFTLFDEETGTEINATANPVTFQATFNLGASYLNLFKNYTINNQSVGDSQFDFCTNNYANAIYSDMELYYTATSYTDKQYYLNNATLTNVTNEVSLYLLNETNALEFFISVERNLIGLSGVTVNIDKYFVGEGIHKTVEIDETDTEGEFTAYLDLDKEYKFTIVEDGSVIGIIEKRATCKAAPCSITLTIEQDIENVFSSLDSAFASNVLYNLSFNPNTKIVTFQFIDTTGLATYFRMVVYQTFSNQSDISISDQKLYTSSGTITFNVSAYSGDFRAETYMSRSPEITIEYITFIINDIVETLGILGLFTSLILVLVIVFGLSFKPPMLIFAVPLSLTIAKLMAFVSLSNTSILLIYVLAIIAVVAISK